MIFMFLLFLTQSAFSIRVSTLHNVYDRSNDSIPVTMNGTCQECMCQAFVLSPSSSYVAFNCYIIENKCDLFHNYSVLYQLLSNTSSKFYFYPNLPPLMIFTTLDITTDSTSLMTNSDPTTSNDFQFRWNPIATTVAGITGSSGTAANQLMSVRGLSLFSSNILYVADKNNNRVQRWSIGALNGSTAAGHANGTIGSTLDALSGPTGTAVDSNDNIYVADSGNNRVVLWSSGASSGAVVAGNGTAGSALNLLHTPCDCSFDSDSGMLFIADTSNDRVMQYAMNASSGIVVAGGNGNGNNITQLNGPKGVCFDLSSNSLYISNTGSHNIVRWILNDTSWTLVIGSSSGTSGPTSTMFSSPIGIAVDSMGNVYVADRDNYRIQFYLAGESNGTTIAGVTSMPGNDSTRLNSPSSVVVDDQFNVYVADNGNYRVQKFSLY